MSLGPVVGREREVMVVKWCRRRSSRRRWADVEGMPGGWMSIVLIEGGEELVVLFEGKPVLKSTDTKQGARAGGFVAVEYEPVG